MCRFGVYQIRGHPSDRINAFGGWGPRGREGVYCGAKRNLQLNHREWALTIGAHYRCSLQCRIYGSSQLTYPFPDSGRALSQAEAQLKMRRWEANKPSEFFADGTSV